MVATTSESTPVVIDADGVQVRTREIGGDLTVCFVRLPAGTDLGPALVGLPDDLCPCPHWGYLFRGEISVAYDSGQQETFGAGHAFYTPAGHTSWRAVAGTEMLMFSPADLLAEVEAAITTMMQASAAPGAQG